MISRKEKQAASDPVTRSYEDMEDQIMQNIIRHVRNYGQLIDSDDWLMQKLAEIGKLNQENIWIIARAAGAQQAEVRKMCYEVADTVTKRLDQTLNQSTAPKRSPNVEKAIRTVHKQARDSLNLTNTRMLYSAQEAYKQLVRTVFEKSSDIAKRKEFLNILGEHATAEAIGAESRGQAIRSVIREFNDKGIPAFVDKAGRQWTPEAYVSMTLRTTAGNVATEAMMGRMDDLGLNLIQVSSHSGARPKCARDQGKIFDKNNKSGYVEDIDGKKHRYYPLSSSSYGEPDGLFGINCGHHGTPFLPGVSSARYEPTKDLKENDEEYQKMQTQRGLERSVRKQKRLCALYDEVGDGEAFEEAAATLKSKEAALKDYAAKNSLTRRKDREQVFGFDKRVSAKAVAANRRIENIFVDKKEKKRDNDQLAETNNNGIINLNNKRKTYDLSKYKRIPSEELKNWKKQCGVCKKDEYKQIAAHAKPDGSKGGYVKSHQAWDFNSKLRAGLEADLDQDDKNTLEMIRKVCSENKTDRPVILDRFVSSDYLTEYEGHFNRFREDLVDDAISFINKKLIGVNKTEKAIVSASYSDANVLTDRDIHLKIHCPQNTHMFVTNNKRESEVLMRDGLIYEYVGASKEKVKGLFGSKYRVVIDVVVISDGV